MHQLPHPLKPNQLQHQPRPRVVGKRSTKSNQANRPKQKDQIQWKNQSIQEGPEGNWQEKTQAIALISSSEDHIIYWLKLFPEQVLAKKIELKAIMEGSSLKTIALELKKNLMGTLETNATQSPQPQTQPSPLTQPSSTHTRLMEHQMEIQLETSEIMITLSKALAKDIS